jgi:hypothetical protein
MCVCTHFVDLQNTHRQIVDIQITNRQIVNIQINGSKNIDIQITLQSKTLTFKLLHMYAHNHQNADIQFADCHIADIQITDH